MLNELRDKAFSNAKNKGFHNDKPVFAKEIMLIVTELSEAVEASRKGMKADLKNFYLGLDDNNFEQNFNTFIKDSVEDEIADAFIRLFDLCGIYNINIDLFVKMKMKYNEGREYLHGKKY